MSLADVLATNRGKLLGGGLLLLALVVPLGSTGYYLQVLLRLILFLGLVASWNLTGYTGYISFGHAAFYGTGAYLLGISMAHLELPFFAGVLLGGIVAALLAGVLGAITLKLSGHYFSIASLLLLIITSVIFTNLDDIGPLVGLPDLSQEIIVPVPEILPGLNVTLVFYYLLLAVAVGLVLFSVWLERSRFGYGMRAIREDEEVAEGLGVPTLQLKVLSILLTGFGVGIVGAVYAGYVGYIDTTTFFSLALTFEIVFIGMIGSLGRWYGPIVGVLLFIPTNEFMTTLVSPELGRIALGCLFIVVIILLPKGLGSYLAGWLRDESGGSGGKADLVAED